MGALLAALRALRFEGIPQLNPSDDAIEAFTTHPIDRLTLDLAKRYLEASRVVETVNRSRAEWSMKAHRFLTIAAVATFISAGLYLAWKAQNG